MGQPGFLKKEAVLIEVTTVSGFCDAGCFHKVCFERSRRALRGRGRLKVGRWSAGV